MSRKVTLPSLEQVRQAMREVVAEAQTAGRRPTVVSVAGRVGLHNATFWRHFPDLAEELRSIARTRIPQAEGSPDAGRYAELERHNTRLRRTNQTLTEQLALAVASIQRLTLDNHHLRQELHAATKVTSIDRPRRR